MMTACLPSLRGIVKYWFTLEIWKLLPFFSIIWDFLEILVYFGDLVWKHLLTLDILDKFWKIVIRFGNICHQFTNLPSFEPFYLKSKIISGLENFIWLCERFSKVWQKFPGRFFLIMMSSSNMWIRWMRMSLKVLGKMGVRVLVLLMCL